MGHAGFISSTVVVDLFGYREQRAGCLGEALLLEVRELGGKALNPQLFGFTVHTTAQGLGFRALFSGFFASRLGFRVSFVNFVHNGSYNGSGFRV